MNFSGSQQLCPPLVKKTLRCQSDPCVRSSDERTSSYASFVGKEGRFQNGFQNKSSNYRGQRKAGTVGSTRRGLRTRAHLSAVTHALRSPPGVRPRGERVSERGSARSRQPGPASSPGRPSPRYPGTARLAGQRLRTQGGDAMNAARNL